MELNTVERIRDSFYRLVGSTSSDTALVEQGESTNDVANQFLTRGSRKAQRWMLKQGYGGWRIRSSALSFSGTDASDGGRYATLPTNFLKAVGNFRVSALREANGDPWGTQVDDRDDTKQGDGYYLRGDKLWLLRRANPPATLYLDYHYTHPVWDSTLDDNEIDFPLEARSLIVAEAANDAKEENWLPGGQDLELKIERALVRAREEAKDIARLTTQVKTFQKPRRVGKHW